MIEKAKLFKKMTPKNSNEVKYSIVSKSFNKGKKTGIDSSLVEDEELKIFLSDKESADVEVQIENNKVIKIHFSQPKEPALAIPQKPRRQFANTERFLNPYNFVDVSDFTPKYDSIDFQKFEGYSGKIGIKMKVETPLALGDKREELENGHKRIGFYKRNGQPMIPSTSIKGMLRSRIETISNSCFNHDYSQDEIMNYLSRRLDPDDATNSQEIRKLKTGILVRIREGWKFVELDKAKILTVIDRFPDKKLSFAFSNEYGVEKISNSAGIDKYVQQKHRCEKQRVNALDIDRESFMVNKVNDREVNEQEMNKTFAYIDLNEKHSNLYAIIRKLTRITDGKKRTIKCSVKAVAYDPVNLERKLHLYIQGRQEELDKKHDNNERIDYAISEVYVKYSFDIDSKTQDKFFFRFGERNLEGYIAHNNGITLTNDYKSIVALNNILKKRKEELQKLYPNDSLLHYQPSKVRDGLLVYASIDNNEVNYFSFSEVARKPYKYGVADIVNKMGKNVCDSYPTVCPACNIFGNVSSKGAKAGKLAISDGKIQESKGFMTTTLDVLSSPKPTFGKFYIIDNRTMENKTYDDNIKIGRKVYLSHGDASLSNNVASNLNSTVELLKTGSSFSFSIDFVNLTAYELGLILYSLRSNIKNSDKKTMFSIGMGKPLGLGQLSLENRDVKLIDRKERYRSLTNLAEKKLSEKELKEFETGFKIIQSAPNQDEFNKRVEDLNQISVSDFVEKNKEKERDFWGKSYINELNKLMLINRNDTIYMVKYPSQLDEYRDNGFEWFKKSRDKVENRLFDPKKVKDDGSLENNELLDKNL